jgi:hypothetical protein
MRFSLKKTFYSKSIADNVKDSRKLWATLKKILPNKSSSTAHSVKTSKDGFTSSAKDTANVFNEYFTSIGSTLGSKFDVHKQGHDSTIIEQSLSQSMFNFNTVSSEFVFEYICSMSNACAPGMDLFSVKLLKLAAPYISNSLAYICNLSLCTGVFPADWKKAKVTPIFKAGEKSDVGNYRPISVLPLISKIIERAVHNQLYSYLTSNELLSVHQSGFRGKHSTTTTLIDVQDFILKNMNKGCVTGAIFLDLKKAFDTVNHSLLIDKLSEIGIKGISLDWFRSYLSDRYQAVNINCTLSDFKPINIGVPQGSILGPLLFIIFVNSLPDSVNCKCVMYTDDATLLCAADNPATLESELQSNMLKIADWFNDNNLTLNIKKTKLMIFGSRHTLDLFNGITLHYNNVIIKKVDQFKYLGVIFDPLLSLSVCISNVVV